MRKVLGAASTLGKAIDAEMAQLTGPAAMKPLVPDDSKDWKELPRGRWGEATALGKLNVSLDPATGAIVGLSRGSGRQWASASQPLARFAYATHDAAQAAQFAERYFFRGPKACGWCGYAFGKDGLTPALANASVSHGTVSRMWQRADGSALAYELRMDGKLVKHYGAPASAFVELSSKSSGLGITLRTMDKTATRLPESLWMEFRPSVPAATGLRLCKMNSTVDPGDVVANGTSLHGTDDRRGVLFAGGGGESLRLVGLDTGQVAVSAAGKTLNLWDFADARAAVDARDGVAWNLFNNLWTTNYVYWYPWRNRTAAEDDGVMTFRWALAL